MRLDAIYLTAALGLPLLKAGGWLTWDWLMALALIVVPLGTLIVLAVAAGAYLLVTGLFDEGEPEK